MMKWMMRALLPFPPQQYNAYKMMISSSLSMLKIISPGRAYCDLHLPSLRPFNTSEASNGNHVFPLPTLPGPCMIPMLRRGKSGRPRPVGAAGSVMFSRDSCQIAGLLRIPVATAGCCALVPFAEIAPFVRNQCN
jgi:hypothetical protein